MEYKFDRVAVSNSQQATDHLNKMASDEWRPVFFFDMGSHNLGVVFERLGPVNQSMPVVWKTPVPTALPEKRGPGRPKKVAMED